MFRYLLYADNDKDLTTPTVKKTASRLNRNKNKKLPKSAYGTRVTDVWKELMHNLESSLIGKTMDYVKKKINFQEQTGESLLTEKLKNTSLMKEKIFDDFTVMFYF